MTSSKVDPNVGVLTFLRLSNTSLVKYFFNKDFESEAWSLVKPASNFSSTATSTISDLFLQKKIKCVKNFVIEVVAHKNVHIKPEEVYRQEDEEQIYKNSD
jgi:hypothetical protein